MIHASVELIEAMRGRAPRFRDHCFDKGLRVACGCEDDTAARMVFGCLMNGPAGDDWTEDGVAVDCPACLRLMREATDPVRWDYLEERGLAPKLRAA